MFEWLVAMFARFREVFEAARGRGIGPSWVWNHSLEILLAMTIVAGIVKRKAQRRSTIVVAKADLQHAFERVVTEARQLAGSISTEVPFPVIQDLLRKKMASQPALTVYCLSPGTPKASMVEHIASILREFPSRLKGSQPNVFIAILEDLPDGVNVCFNERMVVITSDAHTVLGSDCIAIVSSDRALVDLACNRAISLYRESRSQIRYLRALHAVMRDGRGTASHPTSAPPSTGIAPMGGHSSRGV